MISAAVTKGYGRRRTMRKSLMRLAGIAGGALFLAMILWRPASRTGIGSGSSTGSARRARDQGQETETAGPGQPLVWVNRERGVYHCPGTRWYGKTAAGEYMTEEAALGEGHRPASGRPCEATA
jgi:hypothetical protein